MTRRNTIELPADRYAALQARNTAARAKPSAGDRQVATKRVRERGGDPGRPKAKERDVLKGCIAVLDSHPQIALWWRQNTGAMRDGTRFVKFSFRGASDLMAILKGGKFLAVECKATGKRASPDQAAFLDNVLDAGGYAVCVDSPDKLADYLRLLV